MSTERSTHVDSHGRNSQAPGLGGFFESRKVGYTAPNITRARRTNKHTEAFGKALASFKAATTASQAATVKEDLFDRIKRVIGEFLDGIGSRSIRGAYDLRDAINEEKHDKVRKILSENSRLKEELRKLITEDERLAAAILFSSDSDMIAVFRDIFELGTPDEYRRYMADQCLEPLKARDTALRASTDEKNILDAVADAREALRKVERLEAEVGEKSPLSDAAEAKAKNAKRKLKTAQEDHGKEIGGLKEKESGLSKEIEVLERKISDFKRDRENFPGQKEKLERDRDAYSTKLGKVKAEIEELGKQIGASDDKTSIDELRASIDALKKTMEQQAASLGGLLFDLRGTDGLFDEGHLLEKKANAEQTFRQANAEIEKLTREIRALEFELAQAMALGQARKGGLDKKAIKSLETELERMKASLNSIFFAQGALAKEISALNDLIDNAKKIKTLQLKQKKLSLEREARELPQRIRKTAAQIETITQEQADRPSPEKLREEKAGKEAELGALRRDIASKEEAFAAEEKNLRDELSEKSSRSERLKEELQIERNELATAKTELESAIDCLRRAHGNIPSTMPEEWFSMSEETQGGFTLTTTRASPMLEQVSESPVAMEYLADQLAQLSGVGDVLECISKLYPTTLNSKLQNICRTVFEKICQSTVDAEIRQEANAADLKKEAVNKMADLLMAFKNVDFSSLETKFFPTDSISNESKIRRGIFMEAKRISQEINKLMNTSNPTA